MRKDKGLRIKIHVNWALLAKMAAFDSKFTLSKNKSVYHDFFKA